MNERPKWFLTSKTIIGIIIAAAGLVLDAADVALIENAANVLLAAAPEIVGAIGLLLAAFGRAKAKKPLKALPGDSSETRVGFP